jgi:hypothetical protein
LISKSFHDFDFSTGRAVVNGVQVFEPGWVGVTITNPKAGYGGYTDADGRTYTPVTGTDGVDGGISTATNWDPFNRHTSRSG